jgi:hypothetical protein
MSKAQTVPEIHPDVVLEALLAKGGRSQRLGNLQKVHDICRRQHSGSKDFSTSAIGRICEAEGVLKGRALYNAASADYVSLISAWAAFQGVDKPRRQAAPKPAAGLELLMRIEDPAVRSIMQATMVERDKLRAQLNLLKSQTVVTGARSAQQLCRAATAIPSPFSRWTPNSLNPSGRHFATPSQPHFWMTRAGERVRTAKSLQRGDERCSRLASLELSGRCSANANRVRSQLNVRPDRSCLMRACTDRTAQLLVCAGAWRRATGRQLRAQRRHRTQG